MKLIVGDIHAHPWRWFPPSKTGINSYLYRVRNFIGGEVKSIAEAHNVDTIVFLGDLVDAVSATGKIGIDVLSVMTAAFAKLVEFRIIILSGNHDQAGGGTDWFPAIENMAGLNIWVVRKPVVMDDIGFVPAARRGELLTSMEIVRAQGAKAVMGHFVYSGAKMDNGFDYADSETIPSAWGKEFGLSILGHAHAPQTQERAFYVGSPLRFSWVQRDTGHRRVALLGDKLAMEDIREVSVVSPAFVGPTDRLGDLGMLPAGSFVKWIADDKAPIGIDEVRRQFPAYSFIPVLRAKNRAQTPKPRIQIVSQSEATGRVAMDDSAKRSAMEKFVNYKKSLGELPSNVSEEEANEFGRSLLEHDKANKDKN